MSILSSYFQGFRDGRFPCLIATDVAARGLDIPEVDLVIQCNPPKVSIACVWEGKGMGKGMREVDLVIQCNPLR